MAELLVVRHAQASFGADNYDALSDLGHKQAAHLGAFLRRSGWQPDRLITGTLRRQHETLASMGFDAAPEQHPGWNEYDFHDLLAVRFGGTIPDDVRGDRRTHFRTLRETIFEWQAGGLAGARETWQEFTARVADARRCATRTTAERVLVISSGGVIGQLVADCLQAPPRQMMQLNLQVKNTSMHRFIFSGDRFFLHEFNATPHFASPEGAALLTYS